MFRHPRSFSRMFQGLLLGCLAALLPLHAQLDPRLQGSKTDFLDLYQASTSLKAKPEIVTVFDFSGSMAALMYHPLFVNTDALDSSPKGNMSFSLSPGTGATTPGTYTIRATSVQNTNVWAEIYVTVGSNTVTTRNNGEFSFSYGSGGSRRYLWTRISNITRAPTGTTTTGTSYTFSATVTMRGSTDSGGYRATNLSNVASACGCTFNSGLTWTVSGPWITTLSPAATSGGTVGSGTSWTSSVQSTAWVAPAAGAPVTPGTVTATLQGNTVGTLTSTKLIKPSGDIVTESDADVSTTTASGLYGATFGKNDVRNWVRAASHVRFEYLDGSVLRTLDIPIPWKLTSRNSDSNPLTSWKMPDPVFTRINSDFTTSTYGSGTDIEMDRCYTLSHGSQVLTGDATQQTSTTLQTTRTGYVGTYRADYIDWLFKGKYQNADASSPNYTTNSFFVGKYIVFDAANANLVAGQGNANWGQGHGSMGATEHIKIPLYALDGITYLGDSTSDLASLTVTPDPLATDMRIPGLTRAQAVKRAAIQTWINFQADVFWAYRFLDVDNEANPTNGNTINNNSKTTLDATDPSTTVMDGGDSGWTLLNGNSVAAMSRIASLFAYNGTPLTYATARALAQFTDPNSVFNSVETGLDAPSQCGNHFLIVFTDGADNNNTSTPNQNMDTPYLVAASGTTKVNALAGNRAIIANRASIDRTGSYWNMFTFAGVAAHMCDSSMGAVGTDYLAALNPGTTTTSGTPRSFLPYAIKKRNGVDFGYDHPITTMAVGVSLGGKYTDSGAKRNLFLTAAVGDKGMPATEDISTLTPFVWEAKPGATTDFPEVGQKKSGSLYFFDATNPEKLNTDLRRAFLEMTGAPNINATANPNLPFVGASLGKQIYAGKFQPPVTGGAVWPGDLLMFGTREVNGQTLILDKTGSQASTLDANTAQWSAKDALFYARLWSARKLYTRVPGGTALKPFTDTGTDYSDATNGLQKYVTTSLAAGSAAQRAVIQFAAGGDTVKGPYDADGRPTVNRTNIMGDIINSAPAALEYKWSDVSARLTPRLAAVGGNRFRLILVGTNQGWLHAFGEVTKTTTLAAPNPNAGQQIIEGAVDELWSFMPTDFLANLNYITVPNNPHRFMVDGSPALYHLDLPPSGGGAGNGVVDSTERAIAVIGLRKGGRSYYALDIHDPFTPTLQWTLVPDEAASFPSTRILAGGPTLSGVTDILAKWGFSTCTPAFGRIQFNSVIRDAVFLGGGFSVPEVEASFPDGSGNSTPLGRSVMALDVYSGAVLAVKNLTDSNIGGSTVGPVAGGLIPFEYILNSGMAQRAYFLDYKGGLWAWGSKAVSATDPYVDFRIDSSQLTNWSMRKVYQDSNKTTALGARYSTLPAPFRVGTFPGVGKAGSVAPSAVGVAMVSGDRNNPLDQKYNTTTDIAPINHRLTVVFDRQDSRAWGLDSAAGPDAGITDGGLANFTDNNVSSTPANACGDDIFKYITPGCPDYYLASYTVGPPNVYGTPKFGYYVNFPSIDRGFTPKGINPPMVVAGSLFYTYFQPIKADPCKPGDGESYSWLITDVKNPIVKDTRSGFVPLSGQTDKWAGVASDYIAVGTRGVLQGGAVLVSGAPTGSSLTTPEIHTIRGTASQRFPKPRVWRTVH